MLIDNIVAKSSCAKREPNDYINQEDGLLYCGNEKCHTPKEMYLTDGRKVRTLCKCGKEKRDKRELKEKLERKQAMLQGEISPCFQKARFENVNINKHNNVIQLKNYINNFKTGANFSNDGIGLFIYGDTGNGKTYLASCLANEMQKQGYWVIMSTMQDALARIQNFDTRDQFDKDVHNCDLLILDDFGAETQNDYSKAKVEEIINTRCNSKKPIVITTNYNRNDLIDSIEKKRNLTDLRVYERIISMTHGIIVEVPSVRQQDSARRFEEIENILNRGL